MLVSRLRRVCSGEPLFPCIRFCFINTLGRYSLFLADVVISRTTTLNLILTKFQVGGVAGPGYQVSVWMRKANNRSTLSG